MAAYAGYIPVAQTVYLLQGMFSEEKLAQLLATGVLNLDALGDAILRGDFINVPQAIQVDDFSSVDLTSTTALTSATRATTVKAIAPILRKYSLMTFTEHDNIRTNENWRELFAASAGNKLAKQVITSLHSALQGVMGVAGLNHLNNEGTAAITVQSIRKTKRLLKDQGHLVETMLIHPDVWADLIYDLTVNYKYSGNMAGEWLANGYFESVFGIKNVIVSNDLTPGAGATSSAGDDQYYTWFFRVPDAPTFQEAGGPIYFGYQAAPRYSEFVDSRVPSTLMFPKWNADLCLGVRGMAYTDTTANPTDANLADSSKWGVAYSDHRNVGVVGLLTKGNVF